MIGMEIFQSMCLLGCLHERPAQENRDCDTNKRNGMDQMIKRSSKPNMENLKSKMDRASSTCNIISIRIFTVRSMETQSLCRRHARHFKIGFNFEFVQNLSSLSTVLSF